MQPPSSPNTESSDVNSEDRRTLVAAAFSSMSVLVMMGGRAVAPAWAAADVPEVRGTPVNAFNGLAFQYRGNDFDGLHADDLDEPSIPYKEFVEKLKAGQVTFVEFMAPDGDAAYATLQANGSRIRIGEGYPIERHDGYSSPAFAIRTVQDAGVPYKFVVPALARIGKTSTKQ